MLGFLKARSYTRGCLPSRIFFTARRALPLEELKFALEIWLQTPAID
jgi:hypothetical protein